MSSTAFPSAIRLPLVPVPGVQQARPGGREQAAVVPAVLRPHLVPAFPFSGCVVGDRR